MWCFWKYICILDGNMRGEADVMGSESDRKHFTGKIISLGEVQMGESQPGLNPLFFFSP
jgi:hypothetical protein